MPDLLRQGAAWLEQMRTAHCSSPVQYRHGGDVHPVQATFGRTRYEIADEASGGGLTVGAHVWDFLILADALPGVEPEPGDLIVANGQKYEVMALGEDVRGWRWSDPYRTTYRIHTRDIGPSHD
ncbi:MAG: hypothetical protein JJU36_11925 [Phycisphaeraceae bacterium]|nr:hypothetical protein [Phycisphaeraceae bacterium]